MGNTTLYETDLPMQIFEWEGKESNQWWEMLPLSNDADDHNPVLAQFLLDLGEKGYVFETIDGWGPVGSECWKSMIRLAPSKPQIGPHFEIPQNTLRMPPRMVFQSARSYYRTVLHELSHSTGHARRLNRCPTNAATPKDYPIEECIADLSGALLYVNLGGDPSSLMDSWAYYVHGWEKSNSFPINRKEVTEKARASASWLLLEAFE